MKTIIQNTALLYKYILKYTPSFFVITIFYSIMRGAFDSYANVWFIKELLDKISTNAPFSEVLALCGILALVYIVFFGLDSLMWMLFRPMFKQKLHEKMQSELFQKAMELDLANYDNPAFYNDFVWAMKEADDRAATALEDLGEVIRQLIAMSITIGIVFTIDKLVLLLILIAVCINVAFKILRLNLEYKRDNDILPLQRKADYIGRVFYLNDYSKELRLSDAKDILNRDFKSTVKNMIGVFKKFRLKFFAFEMGVSLSSVIALNAGILILLVYKFMVEQSVGVGSFAAAINASFQMFWMAFNMLDYLSMFKRHSMYGGKFKTFLENKPTIRSPQLAQKLSGFELLELNGLSFSYAGSDKTVIKNLSLSIRKGEKIAFVGYNGAGKSTLIKLITRLYDPVSGEIKMNNENIKNYSVSSYRKEFGTVFQDYQIFAATIAENVLADKYESSDKELVLKALDQSGFTEKLNSMPNGIDTELTKEFNQEGVNLSGGEAQKIAISRIFAHPADIMILDEPSSALDPIAEYELNNAMMSASFEKTVIFISHRLSTTIMADKIYMLAGGEIIESGSHDELMRMNGKYAEMFNMQAEKYLKGEAI